MPLRVGYVREHFASPLLQFADDDKGQTFNLVEHPGGTGSLISALQNNEVDVVIALTDPLIAGIARGSDAYKLVGSYVATPLNWAVITGTKSKYHSISDLKDTTIGISRPGSGSQTMAAVMALQHNWFPTDTTNIASKLSFKGSSTPRTNNYSVNDGSTSAFMWEWFTTKPWVDRDEARFIGSVLTPWPSWLIVAHPSNERAPPAEVRAFLTSLSQFVRAFDSQEKRSAENIEFIKGRFNYQEEDIKAWLSTVEYPSHCGSLSANVIQNTLDVLEKAGVVERPPNGFNIEQFIHPAVARLD
ncbi:periplasmic binding protein-like II [Gautieria morchelliformis]|nr:periplasmic binding protein-like II [Gautieria morchelliformis]